MKQISSFMAEIGDEFKIVVVKAIRELCVKYPAKHRSMVNFLAAFLREEGGIEFKKSIVDSIVELMVTIPETKETSLLHLCEFIEDCEFSELIVQILHLIGTIGVLTTAPSRSRHCCCFYSKYCENIVCINDHSDLCSDHSDLYSDHSYHYYHLLLPLDTSGLYSTESFSRMPWSVRLL